MTFFPSENGVCVRVVARTGDAIDNLDSDNIRALLLLGRPLYEVRIGSADTPRKPAAM
jgi:hypothetical protein